LEFIALLDGMLNHELNLELSLVFEMNSTEECVMSSNEFRGEQMNNTEFWRRTNEQH